MTGLVDEASPRRREVIRQSLSVAGATGLYGISFGALSVASGLDLAATMVLSLLLFSGGSQFALVGILGAGGSGGAAIATSALLGIRNGLYGLQLTRLLDVRGLRRVFAAQLTIDESTAVAVSQPDPRDARTGFWWTGIGVFVCWNAMTFLGAVLGDAMGDPRRYGLDAAAAAAFLALLWPRLGTGRNRLVALLAGLVAATLIPNSAPGVPVLVAGLVAVAFGALGPTKKGDS